MSKVILYTNLEGYLVTLVPATNCGLTIKQIAEKDVPEGIPYHIVDVSELPTDLTFRDAWIWE